MFQNNLVHVAQICDSAWLFVMGQHKLDISALLKYLDEVPREHGLAFKQLVYVVINKQNLLLWLWLTILLFQVLRASLRLVEVVALWFPEFGLPCTLILVRKQAIDTSLVENVIDSFLSGYVPEVHVVDTVSYYFVAGCKLCYFFDESCFADAPVSPHADYFALGVANLLENGINVFFPSNERPYFGVNVCCPSSTALIFQLAIIELLSLVKTLFVEQLVSWILKSQLRPNNFGEIDLSVGFGQLLLHRFECFKERLLLKQRPDHLYDEISHERGISPGSFK